MISSKQLAHKLIGLVRAGVEPRLIAETMAGASYNAGLRHILRNTVTYLEKYHGAHQEREGAMIHVADGTPQATTERVSAHFGEKGALRVENNSSLIGGMRIRKGDMLFDGSVKKRLAHLRKSLA